ncbi:MAG: TRAP transporter small permease subunit, partial [Paracoccus sp. (in: a-proteobacteria)]
MTASSRPSPPRPMRRRVPWPLPKNGPPDGADADRVRIARRPETGGPHQRRGNYHMPLIRLIDSINEAVGRVVSVVAVLFAGIIIYDVVMRYVFGQPTLWAFDLTKHLYGFYFILLGGYALRHQAHVRVDLVYSAVGHRAKRAIDMAGSLLFMMPMAILIWLYAWFFMWRTLVTPKVSASDKLDLLLRKARIVKWNVETIGFSPNGFNAYFLFKVLIVLFTALVFLQAIAFFYRSYLELVEGEDSAGKYLDLD